LDLSLPQCRLLYLKFIEFNLVTPAKNFFNPQRGTNQTIALR